MIWRIVFRPRFWRAKVRDLRNAVAAAAAGPTCRVTGERVDPEWRVRHEADEHPTDGPCVLL